jgi:hypothetical protein
MMLLSALQITLGLGGGGFDAASGEALLLGTFKIFFIIGALLYVLFAFIVIRQVHIMRKTLITEFSPFFTLLAYGHFALALMVLLLYLFIL